MQIETCRNGVAEYKNTLALSNERVHDCEVPLWPIFIVETSLRLMITTNLPLSDPINKITPAPSQSMSRLMQEHFIILSCVTSHHVFLLRTPISTRLQRGKIDWQVPISVFAVTIVSITIGKILGHSKFLFEIVPNPMPLLVQIQTKPGPICLVFRSKVPSTNAMPLDSKNQTITTRSTSIKTIKEKRGR